MSVSEGRVFDSGGRNSYQPTLTLQVPTIEGTGAPRTLYSRYPEGYGNIELKMRIRISHRQLPITGGLEAGRVQCPNKHETNTKPQ